MTKTQVEVQFTIPINETLLHHKTDAEKMQKRHLSLKYFNKGTSVLVKPRNFVTYRDEISRN